MIKIVEVGPRDGLQNEPSTVPTNVKLMFINKLLNAGIKNIEVASFVSPKWVPQMADHYEIVTQLQTNPTIRTIALTPNEKGLCRAIEAGTKSIAVFASASETFSQKNINCSISESLSRYEKMIAKAKSQNIWVRGYISCVLGCPYEGKISLIQIEKIARALYKAGCNEISLGDTIGVGTPSQAKALIKAVKDIIPLEQLAIHFHDTYGQALANIYACLDEGITIIDSSVSGLGGCPYAQGASGNVATEEVIYMLQGLGLSTGIDLPLLVEAGDYICTQLKITNHSKVSQVLLNQKKRK